MNSLIKSFTLLESLLVLAITSFMFLIFSMSLTTTLHSVKGELFALEFENLYKDAQEDAALSGTSETLAARNGVLFFENQKLTVPSEVLFHDFTVCFDEKGENSSLTQIQIFLPEEKKTIHYQLEMGSGKFKKTVR